jgi:hypothetical protein
MAVQHRPQLDQAGDRDLGATRCDRRTGSGIAHPGRDLARQTRPYLDVEDLAPGTSLPAVDANPLTVERMPGIRHDNKLRSVC